MKHLKPILIFALFWSLSSSSFGSTVAVDKNGNTTLPPINGVKTINKELIISNPKDPQSPFIDINYPQIQSNHLTPQQTQFNIFIENRAKKEFNDAQQDLKDNQSSGQDSDYSLSETYTLSAFDPQNLISIRFDGGSDSSSQAHPESFSEAFNFDLKNGKFLSLNDLFKPPSNYLRILSMKIAKNLTSTSASDYSVESLADLLKNNTTGVYWNITKKSLVIAFDYPLLNISYADHPDKPIATVIPCGLIQNVLNAEGSNLVCKQDDIQTNNPNIFLEDNN